VFENRIPRRMFRTKRDEGTGGWRKPHNGELYNLHFYPDMIRIKLRSMRQGMFESDVAFIKGTLY
jgi:hypothetical protein